MLYALLLVTALADWVPMRWKSADPASLELLRGTAVNCIVLEREHATPELIAAARKASIATAVVLRPSHPPEAFKALATLRPDAVVLEGDFPSAPDLPDGILRIDLPSRAQMRFTGIPVAGTSEGIWPGIQVDEGGATKSAPSGAPWVNTNTGFLRFVRAAAPPGTPVWIAYSPPANAAVTAERYLQAIADTAIAGARWVLTFDPDWLQRFYARDAAVLDQWKKITAVVAYFESHREWRTMEPLSQLAIVQDVESGALFSGGVLDMIAVKHTPVRLVPSRKLTPAAMSGAKLAVNVDPSGLTEPQKEALQSFTRGGGTMLNGPASWKFPAVRPGQITLSEADVKTLDDIWKEMNSMTGRRNLGARLFNVSSMLSNLLQPAGGGTAVLHLVNYSGYPVENVTVHLLGKFSSALFHTPGQSPRKLEVYAIEEGTGVDIDRMAVLGTLVLEP